MKAVNFVLGLGTAIILVSLIVLGIKAFYPEPVYPSYPPATPVAPYPDVNCAAGDIKCQQAQNANYQAQQNADQQFQQAMNIYQGQEKIYDKNLFIIANIVGIIVFALGFWLLFSTAIAAQSVPIGIMISGLWSIIYGYWYGWESIDDRLKFFVGLIVAVVVIGGSMWLIQRYAAKRKEK